MSLSLQDFHRMVGGLAHEFEATGLHPSQYHQWCVKRMNMMYSLPINTTPSLDKLDESPVQRMTGFLKTLRDEMDEGLEILAMLVIREMRDTGDQITPETIQGLIQSLGIKDQKRATNTFNQITTMLLSDRDTYSEDVLVNIADWLGDMKVYIDSESLKYGIMLSPVLACIMGSNFTKLNERGEVIKDPNGKVQKGPNFTPPEGCCSVPIACLTRLGRSMLGLIRSIRWPSPWRSLTPTWTCLQSPNRKTDRITRLNTETMNLFLPCRKSLL
jgi:hypothetical protein